MALQKYLRKFENHRRISLVGPLCVYHCKHEEPTIFVDGGSAFRIAGEGISVGDGDSFAGKIDVELDPQKDFSDLAFALGQIPAHFCEVILCGFLGGRRDHELFNIGEAHHFLRARLSPTRVSFDDEIIGYSAGAWQFERLGLFSIAVIEQTAVALTGDCLYTCPDKTIFTPVSSLGLSNQGSGTVSIECEGPVFILFDEA